LEQKLIASGLIDLRKDAEKKRIVEAVISALAEKVNEKPNPAAERALRRLRP
jgi:hypothetical protein